MNARLSTKNGLRVGAPFRDAQRMYGEPLLTGGEDGLIAVYRLEGAELLLRFMPEPEWDRKYLTDATRIVEILILDAQLVP